MGDGAMPRTERVAEIRKVAGVGSERVFGTSAFGGNHVEE
jgi:hypothetical protein